MFVVDDKQIESVGFESKSWKDNPAFRIKMGEDAGLRGDQRVNCVGIHTTEGDPGTVRPGRKDHSNGAQQYIQSWKNSKREAAAHCLIGHDAILYCIADLKREMAYHIPGLNRVSIGIEIVQINGVMYEDQFITLGYFCKQLAKLFRVQPMIHLPYKHHAIERISQGKFYGFLGHRDARNDRGEWDPGNPALFFLRDHFGFEAFDVSKDEDKTVWMPRQAALGFAPKDCDGVPGERTSLALEAAGYKNGIYAFGRA